MRVDHSPARIGNGAGLAVVNADGSITLAPVGLATIGKIYYATLNGLAAALAAAGSNGHVVVTDSQAVTTTLTVPTGATLEIKRGGLITFSGAGALTINGTLADGLHPMFAGGTPTFGAGSVAGVRPEWYGGRADWNGTTGTDNRAALDLMLTSGATRFLLLRGNYLVNTADAHGNAVTLTVAGMRLSGAGLGSTNVVVGCATTWGVQSAAAQCHVEDLSVTWTGTPAAVYGIGADLISPATSAEDQVFARLRVATSGTQTLTAGFASGPTTNLDVACVDFDHCTSFASVSGAITNGFLFGNGVSGNVLCNYVTDCTAAGSQYGCNANSGGVIWRGGNVIRSTKADFTMSHPSGNPFTVESCRGDTGNMVFYAPNVGGFRPGIVITDYFALNYTATAGQGGAGVLAGEMIHSGLNAAVILEGGMYGTSGANTAFSVSGANGGLTSLLMALGVTTDIATPYPAASANVQRVIIGAQVATGGNPRPIPAYASLIDGYHNSQGLRVYETANGKQGVATLVAGTVTVANTAVTAVSRIFPSTQDSNSAGYVRCTSRVVGTSFTITSSVGTDTGVVAYEIYEPA